MDAKFEMEWWGLLRILCKPFKLEPAGVLWGTFFLKDPSIASLDLISR
jgi:hypothetical protein